MEMRKIRPITFNWARAVQRNCYRFTVFLDIRLALKRMLQVEMHVREPRRKTRRWDVLRVCSGAETEMSRPSIRATLIAIFSLVAIATSVFATTSLISMGDIRDKMDDITNNWLPSLMVAKDIRSEMLMTRMSYLAHLTSTTPEAMEAAEAGVLQSHISFKKAADSYVPLISSDRERNVLGQINDGYIQYVAIGEKMLALSRDHRAQDANQVVAEMRLRAQPIMKAIDELVDINQRASDQSVAAAADTYASSRLLVIGLTALMALIIIAATFYGIAGIASPIHRITVSMRTLAGGDTAKAIPYAGRADEIGAMAGAVEVFRNAAIENKRLETEAESARLRSDGERADVMRSAETEARSRLLNATSSLAAGLRRLASGDLAFQIEQPFAPDFEALRHDLNSTVRQLAASIGAVALSATSIDGGAREIAQASDDLSKRTEQQAASLEETAAALDQITANVSSSSQRAQEARSVAIEANVSARESGSVVMKAIDAMERIEASSGQIANIIGVIDEIAFQTNLLALNAGVEAARAGEAGRGFAVVAQEVRELAQRSAKAAKEIKELIRGSTSEVEGGVNLVRETGVALQKIERLVVMINGHMDAIALSSREQSVGLVEVNTAVNQMDQVTQKNAAMVEETNASSASLVAESARLKGTISQFSLGQEQRTDASGLATKPKAVRTPSAADRSSKPAPSPARQMVGKLSQAFKGHASAVSNSWEEF